MIWLSPDQVAERLGVHRKTAMAYMMEMNPVVISGKTRKRYRVSEMNLNIWMLKHSVGGKPSGNSISKTTGSNQKMKRR